jgi:hypothetical protein
MERVLCGQTTEHEWRAALVTIRTDSRHSVRTCKVCKLFPAALNTNAQAERETKKKKMLIIRNAVRSRTV